jgi:hypothetical protein
MLYQNNAHWHGEAAQALADVDLVLAAAEDSLASISTSYKQSAKPTHVSIHRHTPPTPPPLPPLGKEVARGGNGGSGGAGGTGGEGGAGGTGGEGGQGGKNVGDITSTSKANINQKANGGHAGNANGGDVRIYGNGDDQKAKWIGGSDQQDQNQKAMGNDQNQKAMGNDQNQKAMGNDQNQKAMGNDQNQNSVVCRNTAVNNAGHGFGANGVESQDLGNNVPSQDLGQSG